MGVKFTGATLFDAMEDGARQVAQLESSRDFYMRRCEALQLIQSQMRDPERKMVCDILANGLTYSAGVNGKKHDGPCWRNSHADCGC